MIGDIDHDVLAAVIGGVALIVVATLPILWRQVQGSRRDDRQDMASVRERIDLVLRRMDEMQERRATEHHLLEAQLAEVKQLLLDDLIRGDSRRGGT